VPSWPELLQELQKAENPYDLLRRRYLRQLSELTGRNTIIYYSAWLQKSQLVESQSEAFSVNDNDKNGFMATIHGMDRSKGLDLFLHTPGGSIAATESLVSYLRSMFGTNIRAIVPQLAMSAGTMVACSCREIIMGLHSSIGPIDPQLGGVPAHGIVEEFEQAAKEIKDDESKIAVWRPIIAKYHPTLIGECQKAIKWSNQMVAEWLETGMFKGKTKPSAKQRAKRVMTELGDHALTLSHARHISLERADEIGLVVTPLEANDALQDAILTVHHLTTQALSDLPVVKLMENQDGVAFVQNPKVQVQQVLGIA
jgi:ClpP class serine protease